MSAIVNSRHSRAADDPRLAHVSDDTSDPDLTGLKGESLAI
jgi:hypothetical protein